MSSKMSSSTKNILTGAVVAVALILVAAVFLISKIKEIKESKENETVIVSEIISELRTDENGETFFYTMVTRYSRPKYSSNYTYPPTSRPTTTKDPFVEVTSYEYVTDENGNPVFDENGNYATEVVTYTVPAEEVEPPSEYEPSTENVAVTDENGNPVLDENGNPVTEVVTLPPPETTTRENIWDDETERPGPGFFPTRDDALAEDIVRQINQDRADRGLDPLVHDQGLKADARVQSTYNAAPELGGEDVNYGTSFETSYGGSGLYQTVMGSVGGRAFSADVTKVGVGVVKLNGTYYTTIILA